MQEQLKEAEEKQKQVAERKKSADEALRALTDKRESEQGELTAINVSDFIRLAKDDPRVQEKVQQVAQKMGLEHDNATIDEVREVVKQSRMLFGRLKQVFHKEILSVIAFQLQFESRRMGP